MAPPLPPEIRTNFVYPSFNGIDLDCAPEPAIGAIGDNRSFGAWSEDDRVAGEDCRSKLSRVRSYVKSWPQPGG